MAYNDWGLNIDNTPQLGLGGDINGGSFRGIVTDAMVRSPVEMIAVADARALESTANGLEANLDPTSADQWPGARHNRRCDILFAEGHVETAARKDVINPDNLKWRSRWNNDNDPHVEVKWSVDWGMESAQP